MEAWRVLEGSSVMSVRWSGLLVGDAFNFSLLSIDHLDRGLSSTTDGVLASSPTVGC